MGLDVIVRCGCDVLSSPQQRTHEALDRGVSTCTHRDGILAETSMSYGAFLELRLAALFGHDGRDRSQRYPVLCSIQFSSDDYHRILAAADAVQLLSELEEFRRDAAGVHWPAVEFNGSPNERHVKLHDSPAAPAHLWEAGPYVLYLDAKDQICVESDSVGTIRCGTWMKWDAELSMYLGRGGEPIRGLKNVFGIDLLQVIYVDLWGEYRPRPQELLRVAEVAVMHNRPIELF